MKLCLVIYIRTEHTVFTYSVYTIQLYDIKKNDKMFGPYYYKM